MRLWAKRIICVSIPIELKHFAVILYQALQGAQLRSEFVAMMFCVLKYPCSSQMACWVREAGVTDVIVTIVVRTVTMAVVRAVCTELESVSGSGYLKGIWS